MQKKWDMQNLQLDLTWLSRAKQTFRTFSEFERFIYMRVIISVHLFLTINVASTVSSLLFFFSSILHIYDVWGIWLYAGAHPALQKSISATFGVDYFLVLIRTSDSQPFNRSNQRTRLTLASTGLDAGWVVQSVGAALRQLGSDCPLA